MENITLFHESNLIVEKPELSQGNIHNDYGQGFYCTRIEEMAREWASKNQKDGFVNRYELGMDGLRVLNLSDGNHTVLNWIAILLKNRTFHLRSPIAIDAREYLIGHFAIDTTAYDIIVGYRANDSYFQYAEYFVENTLLLRSLNRAFALGKLGLQTVLVSERDLSRSISLTQNRQIKRFITQSSLNGTRMQGGPMCLRSQRVDPTETRSCAGYSERGDGKR